MNPNEFLKALVDMLQEVASAFLRLFPLLCRRLRDCWRQRTGPDQALPCLPIPAGVWLRPDAYLYSQRYLMSLGMAVTWDNPDVTLTDMAGNVVGSHDLSPDTKYRITALIHNKAADAPAPGLPVVFTLIAFGAGGATRQTIGVTPIDLPVRAAPGEPAPASVIWTTPPVPDHYCIEIDAAWPDDAFPIDNVGQHNTVVRRAGAGERLHVRVPIHDRYAQQTRVQARVDSYRLPARPLLREEGQSRAAHLERVVQANAAERFPADPTWGAGVSARETLLDEGGHGAVDFEATVPAGAAAGSEQRFNVSVHDLSSGRAIGGVTVIIQVT